MADTEILSKIGVGSGLDTTALIKALVDADSAAETSQLEKDEEKTNAKISALGTLKANLKQFNSIIKSIQTSESSGFVGNSSNTATATLTASGDAAGADIDSSLTVTTLASSHTLTGPAYSATTSTVGAGSISIAFGTWSADPTSGGGQSHTANSQSTISVNTTSSTTLKDLRDLINNAATDSDSDGERDVLASIIYDGTNYMLMLKSESGASNEMKVTASSDLANTISGVSYNYNATTSNMTQRVSGINAAFTVDGISMTRSSNEIKDLFDGFTLDLLATNSSAIRVSSQVDLTKIKALMNDYVLTYNEVMSLIDSLTTSGDTALGGSNEAGALNGNSLLMSIKSQLRGLSTKSIGGYEGGPYFLSQMGIKTERDGSLTLNQSDLEESFDFNPEMVHAFFSDQLKTDTNGISVSSFELLNTKPGTYAFATNGSTHTIGGVNATKNGTKYSVSSGDPNGLVLNVANGITSGNVYYGKSFLSLAHETVEVFTKFDSVIDTQVESGRSRIKDLAEKRIRLEDRIEKLTQRYQKQYANMESAVAGLNETGNMLTALLGNNDDD